LLSSPDFLCIVVEKLPQFLRNQWSKEAKKIRDAGKIVCLNDIAKFVEIASDIANDPVF
jgi:hypothetical protein